MSNWVDNVLKQYAKYIDILTYDCQQSVVKRCQRTTEHIFRGTKNQITQTWTTDVPFIYGVQCSLLTCFCFNVSDITCHYLCNPSKACYQPAYKGLFFLMNDLPGCWELSLHIFLWMNRSRSIFIVSAEASSWVSSPFPKNLLDFLSAFTVWVYQLSIHTLDILTWNCSYLMRPLVHCGQ